MQQPSLLIVEDDDTARTLLCSVLERTGYRVTAAPDGETAIRLLEASLSSVDRPDGYDVVITDIRMEGTDGISVMHAAKQQKIPPAVILMTGYSSVETAVAALRANAYDYLLKPCDTNDLLRCVEGAVKYRSTELQRVKALSLLTQGLTQLQATQQNTLHANKANLPIGENALMEDQLKRFIIVGDLSIDILRHSATFQNKALQLTPIEYQLLYTLAQTPSNVLNYEEIVKYTHGTVVGTSEAQVLLRAHVRNIRRKIDPSYIVNIRGIGYMLAVPDGTETEE